MKRILMAVAIAVVCVLSVDAGPSGFVVVHTITKKVPQSSWLSGQYRYFFDVYNPYGKTCDIKLRISPKNNTKTRIQPSSRTKIVKVDSRLHGVFYIDCDVAPACSGEHGEYGIAFFEITIECDGVKSSSVKIPASSKYEKMSP